MLLAVWAVAEIALQVYDTYETAQTVLDPCASLAEKGTILGLYVFGLALPGGGYSTAGATGIRSVKRLDQADDLRQTFKLVDRADDTRATTRIGDDVDEIDTIKVVDDLCFHSFSAETLVSTEDGLRPISEIVIGDWVWAYHEGTGKHGLFPVTDVIVHTDPAQVHLMLDGELLETTPEHPFYTLERGWVDAGDLWVGAHIRKAGGSYGMVQFIAVEREPQVMYNLTVDEAHTFFVGAQRWLVHNMSVWDCLSDKAKALGWGNGSSETLRANLKAAGLQLPKAPNAAHHIVAHDAKGALAAIEVMAEYNIHADDAINGVFLRYVDYVGEGANHRVIHTGDYYDEVNRRVTAVQSKEELILTLRDIADELRLDIFPY